MKQSRLNASRDTVGKPHYVNTVKFHCSILPDLCDIVTCIYMFAPLWQMPRDTLNVTRPIPQKSWKFVTTSYLIVEILY